MYAYKALILYMLLSTFGVMLIQRDVVGNSFQVEFAHDEKSWVQTVWGFHPTNLILSVIIKYLTWPPSPDSVSGDNMKVWWNTLGCSSTALLDVGWVCCAGFPCTTVPSNNNMERRRRRIFTGVTAVLCTGIVKAITGLTWYWVAVVKLDFMFTARHCFYQMFLRPSFPWMGFPFHTMDDVAR